MNTKRRTKLRCLAAGVALGVPTGAHAWWRGGGVFGFAPPIFVAPPMYYPPPPVYDAPSPAAYAPAPAGQSCYAGPDVCPLETPAPAGAAFPCPTDDNGRAAGRVG